MTAYIKAALDRACAAIVAAPNGAQETTLHREAFSIGGLIGADLSGCEAFAVLLAAAKSIPAHGEPWRNIERKLRHSLSRGMERPRQRPEAASARQAPAPPVRVDGRALSLWRKSVPIDHTPADLYLRERGFMPPYPATMRYLLGRGEHPHALIAALGLPDEPEPGSLRMPDAAVRAVHLTRLDPTGMSRLRWDDARIIVGRGGLGFPVIVTPINDGVGLLIAEGIENALSLGLSLGLGTWAACSHTRMPALASAVPSYVEAVTIVADPEPAARASATALAEQLKYRDFIVTLKVMGEVA
jgi:hypothetical protein